MKVQTSFTMFNSSQDKDSFSLHSIDSLIMIKAAQSALLSKLFYPFI